MLESVESIPTPVISPLSGEYNTSQEITITCGTAGTTIYYTEDGTTPDNTDIEYTAPFTLGAAKTIKAIATKAGLSDSAVRSETYTIPLSTIDTPVILPTSGEYLVDQEVTITCATEDTTIYYTTDGSTPDNTDIEYTAPFTIFVGTVKAIATKVASTDSAIASETYTINLPDVDTPVILPVSGTYNYGSTAEITCGTSGAAIYYTTDGSTPDNTDTEYTVPILIVDGVTIKAIATKTDYDDSGVASETYSIDPAQPVIIIIT